MKFLPMYCCKQMSHFFGKQGILCHVSAVIISQGSLQTENNKFEVECFVL